MVRKILLNPELNNYNFLAPKGKSLAFTSYLAGKMDTCTHYQQIHLFAIVLLPKNK